MINANKQAFVNAVCDAAGVPRDLRWLEQHAVRRQAVPDHRRDADALRSAGADRWFERQARRRRASVLFKVVDGTTTTTGGHLIFNTTYGKAFYDNLFNAAFVQMEYFGYLQRDPDPDGYAFWLGKLNTVWRLGERGDGQGVHQIA